MDRTRRPRLLAVLLALTVLVVGLDLSRPDLLAPVRDAAATVLGPLERLVTPDDSAQVVRLTAERDTLRWQLSEQQGAARDAAAAAKLARSPAARGRRLVTAQVVGFSSAATPSRTRRVTLDAGARDGITKDLTVIAAGGLVGRVVAVAPWTCDVLVLGDKDLTVGVRVGGRGVLGSLSSGAPAPMPPRTGGRLSLALVEQGQVRVGDRVTTLGSIGDRPFVPGIPVGAVVAVDPQHGRLGRTAAVQPFVDPSSLDVVGIVTPTRPSGPEPPS